MLESYIAALESTREIIAVEQKRIQKEISDITESLAKQTAALSATAAAAAAAALPGGSAGAIGAGPATAAAAVGGEPLGCKESVEIAAQLAGLHGKLRELDADLAALKPLLAAGGVRAEEREIHETKLVVLQVGGGVCLGGAAGGWWGHRGRCKCGAGGAVGVLVGERARWWWYRQVPGLPHACRWCCS